MSRLNRNASYIHVVDGETVWERLRVIRCFLVERRQALAVTELSIERQEAMDKSSFEYREALIMRPQLLDLTQECREEIKFLENFEARLAEEAEKTRIPGKSDDEMYEANFFEEMRVRLVKDAQSEMFAHGSITAQTMKSLLRHQPALHSCIALGYLRPEIEAAALAALPGNAQLAIPLLETILSA